MLTVNLQSTKHINPAFRDIQMKHLFLQNYDLLYGSGAATNNIMREMNKIRETEARMIAGRRDGLNYVENVHFVDYPPHLLPFDLPLTGSMNLNQFNDYKDTFARNLDLVRKNFHPDSYAINHGFVWGQLLREEGTPYVLEFHGTDEEVFKSINYSELRELQKGIIDNAAAILCQCEDHRERAAQTYGINKEGVDIIYSGIDTRFFSPGDYDRSQELTKLGLHDNGRVILGCIARYSREKKVETFLQALKMMSKDERPLTIMVGDGPIEEEVQRFAVDCKLEDDIFFVGKKTPSELIPIYNICDLTVMPGIESFGLAVLESMSCGTPVIGRNHGGTRDTIGGFSEMLLYDGTPEMLREIIELMGGELKTIVKDALVKYTVDNFDLSKSVKKRVAFLEKYSV